MIILLILLSNLSSAEGETKIYIDNIPAYHDLSFCAERPLSTIVRDMQKGCGDDSRLTSYTCFCTESFSKFTFDISTEIVSRCGTGLVAQATSALDVFNKYCAIGVDAGITPTDACM